MATRNQSRIPGRCGFRSLCQTTNRICETPIRRSPLDWPLYGRSVEPRLTQIRGILRRWRRSHIQGNRPCYDSYKQYRLVVCTPSDVRTITRPAQMEARRSIRSAIVKRRLWMRRGRSALPKCRVGSARNHFKFRHWHLTSISLEECQSATKSSPRGVERAAEGRKFRRDCMLMVNSRLCRLAMQLVELRKRMQFGDGPTYGQNLSPAVQQLCAGPTLRGSKCHSWR